MIEQAKLESEMTDIDFWELPKAIPEDGNRDE